MAIKVRRPGQQIEYVLQADRAAEVQTKFLLRPLKWYEMDEVNALSPYTPAQALKVTELFARVRADGRDVATMTDAEKAEIAGVTPRDQGFAASVNRYYAETCKRGLVAVKSALDDKGNPIDMDPKDFMDGAVAEYLHELGIEILKLSRHTGDEVKK